MFMETVIVNIDEGLRKNDSYINNPVSFKAIVLEAAIHRFVNELRKNGGLEEFVELINSELPESNDLLNHKMRKWISTRMVRKDIISDDLMDITVRYHLCQLLDKFLEETYGGYNN